MPGKRKAAAQSTTMPSKRKPASSKDDPLPSPSPSTSISPTTPLFFWGHRTGPNIHLSNFYPITFTAPPPTFAPFPSTPADPLTFTSSEQYMMYAKALVFGDAATAALILEAHSPPEIKALGRQVSGYDDEVWGSVRLRAVEEGLWWKFGGGAGEGEGEGEVEGEKEVMALRGKLLGTGERELVEASPRDRIWGIGFGAEKAEANRARWGMNLLGKALMSVRTRLREQEAGRGEGE